MTGDWRDTMQKGPTDDSVGRNRKNITKRDLVNALRETGIAPIGMSYETAAGQIWGVLNR